MQKKRIGAPRVEQKPPSVHGSGQGTVKTLDLERLAQAYFTDCELQLQSSQTIETRRVFVNNLLWFLRNKRHAQCGLPELRLFFHYLAHGHEEPGGRFGRAYLRQAVRPVTIKDYYICLRSFFTWLEGEGAIVETPFRFIPKPRVREEFKPPLATGEVTMMLRAAETSLFPERDQAILLMLLDTGCRANELVSIHQRNLDLQQRCCRVVGKGDKMRTVYFGHRTAEALAEYLAACRQMRHGLDSQSQGETFTGNDALFVSGRNLRPLKRAGLQQILERLGRRCGIKSSCSPHAFRRTFAVQMLRNGANVFSVQAMLGHSDLQMTRRYCALAQTDVEAQHRRFSPVDCFEGSSTKVVNTDGESRDKNQDLSLTPARHAAVY